MKIEGSAMRAWARLSVVCALVMACAASAWAAGKVEEIGEVDALVGASVKAALEAKGYRVVMPDGSALCEVWFRSKLPASAKTADGALYALTESELVGVIRYEKATTDFRGQAIKPGTYTMRYELLPEDGNHMGVAPSRDFVLLTPAATDADAAAQFKFAQLVAMSRQVSGTNHPAAFALVAAEGQGPSITQTMDGWWVFTAGVNTSSGKMSVAMVVKGSAGQ